MTIRLDPVRTLARPLAFLLPLGMIACTAILDVGSFSSGGATVDGVSNPIGGDAGDDTGASIDAATGADALSDAPATNPTDAGSDAPKPTSCAITNLKIDAGYFPALVHGCVLWTMCDPTADLLDDCITWNDFGTSPNGACLLDASTCSDVQKCTGVASYPQSGPACADAASLDYATAACDDAGNAIQCANGDTDQYQYSYILNCKAFGGTCGTYPDPGFSSSDPSEVQTLAACAVTTGCGPNTNSYNSCVGNSVIFACENDAGIGENCSDLGLVCQANSSGDGCFIATDAGACSTSSDSTCLGAGVAQFCNNAGFLNNYDCTAVGESCLGSYGCVAPGCSAADVQNCNETCSSDGKVATVCIGGAPFNINCPDYNANAFCNLYTDTGQINGSEYAFCTLP